MDDEDGVYVLSVDGLFNVFDGRLLEYDGSRYWSVTVTVMMTAYDGQYSRSTTVYVDDL